MTIFHSFNNNISLLMPLPYQFLSSEHYLMLSFKRLQLLTRALSNLIIYPKKP